MTKKIDGALLGVREASQLLGLTEKCVRARVSRRLLPFRRFSHRIIFVRAELLAFIDQLDGCRPDEARANVESRR